MSEENLIVHPIPPLYDKNCNILILGSFPSVKSREQMFFYGHPQNRFWKLLALIFNEQIPKTIDEKKCLALKHHIAMWDVIHSCKIIGSSDSSIKDVVPNDIEKILAQSNVTRIFCNGTTSFNLYNKYIEPKTHLKAYKLPSTSPANARYKIEDLKNKWEIITYN